MIIHYKLTNYQYFSHQNDTIIYELPMLHLLYNNERYLMTFFNNRVCLHPRELNKHHIMNIHEYLSMSFISNLKS